MEPENPTDLHAYHPRRVFWHVTETGQLDVWIDGEYDHSLPLDIAVERIVWPILKVLGRERTP